MKVLRELGVFDQIAPKVSPETRAALEAPHGARLHPGSVLDETYTALAELRGIEAVAQVMYRVTEASLAGIAGPLARVYMTMLGGGPGPLLQRFDTLAAAGASGFRASWQADGAGAGLMRISAAEVTPPVAEYAWRGTLEYLLAFANVDGRVTPLPREHDGLTLVLRVAWQAR